jgi:pyrimidine deaminase RibD-like protein
METYHQSLPDACAPRKPTTLPNPRQPMRRKARLTDLPSIPRMTGSQAFIAALVVASEPCHQSLRLRVCRVLDLSQKVRRISAAKRGSHTPMVQDLNVAAPSRTNREAKIGLLF